MIEGREDWKKNKIVQLQSSCFLLVWCLLTWKGHCRFHSQLCLGSFTLLGKARRSQQPKNHRLIPRTLDTDQGPYILPFLWYTERHWPSHPASVPSCLLWFFLLTFLQKERCPRTRMRTRERWWKHCRRSQSLLGHMGQGDYGNGAPSATAFGSLWEVPHKVMYQLLSRLNMTCRRWFKKRKKKNPPSTGKSKLMLQVTSGWNAAVMRTWETV